MNLRALTLPKALCKIFYVFHHKGAMLAILSMLVSCSSVERTSFKLEQPIQIDRAYLDDLGLMRAFKGQDDTNSILFYAYAIMRNVIKKDCHKIHYIVTEYIKSRNELGGELRFKQTWRDGQEERVASHDNMTALLYLSTICKLDYITKNIDLSPYLHPRDIAFRKWWLTPIYSAVAITTNFRKQFNEKAQAFDTDGKLLYILRREIKPLWLTDKVSDFLLKWRWGDEYEMALFDIYFGHDPNHPLRRRE